MFIKDVNLPTIIDKLSNADNIKISGNSKGNRVGTVINKLVEKADDITKAINQEVITTSNSFKVGKGNVDVSADVQDGFTNIDLKGNTYCNLAENDVSQYSKVLTTWYDDYLIGSSSLFKNNTTYTVIYNLVIHQDTSNGAYNASNFGLGDNAFEEDAGYTSKTVKSGLNINKFVYNNPNNKSKVWIRPIRRNTTPVEGESITYSFDSLIILEGDHTNNPNLPSYFKGISGVGEKSKNLFNFRNVKIPYGGSNCDRFKDGFKVLKKDNIHYREENIIVKPNTKYTASFKSNIPNQGKIRIRNAATGAIIYDNNSVGVPLTFTTDSDITKIHMELFHPIESNELPSYYDIQLEEGSIATEYQPYDKYEIDILSNGKNLLKQFSLYSSSVTVIEEGIDYIITEGKGNIGGGIAFRNIKVKPNTTYTLSMTCQTISPSNHSNSFRIWQPYKMEYISSSLTHIGYDLKRVIGTFTTPANCDEVIDIWCGKSSNHEEVTRFKFIKDFQLEEHSSVTFSEPYIEDKTQILLDEPLMKLPNGVCDEITRDGKLIKRTYKFKLNRESLNNFVHVWGYQDATTDYIRFYRYIRDTNLPRFSRFSNGNGLCNLISTNANGYRQEKETFGVGGSGENLYISFSISSDKIPNFDFDNYGSVENRNLILDYLDKNNYEIYYELETPMITELSAPSLRIFKDGHLTFNTLVAPTSTHLVQINKSAQIERSIKEVQGLDARVERLEGFYDDMILETAHKLSTLDFDFSLIRKGE